MRVSRSYNVEIDLEELPVWEAITMQVTESIPPEFGMADDDIEIQLSTTNIIAEVTVDYTTDNETDDTPTDEQETDA